MAKQVLMQNRQLGNSDLKVSEIALGSWLTYGVSVEARKARACLAAAIIGASRPEQVRENAAASGVRLDQATLQAIDLLLEGFYTT